MNDPHSGIDSCVEYKGSPRDMASMTAVLVVEAGSVKPRPAVGREKFSAENRLKVEIATDNLRNT